MRIKFLIIFSFFLFSATTSLAVTVPKVTVKAEITAVDCETGRGKIDYEIVVEGGWLNGYKVITFELLDSKKRRVYSHPSNLSTKPTGTIPDLPVGVYTIQGSILVKDSNGDYVPVDLDNTKMYYVGYETEWALNSGYILTPNSYSLERNTGTDPVFARATATNIIQSEELGWLQFNAVPKPSNQITSTPINYLQFSYFTYAPGQATPAVDLASPYISFGQFGSGFRFRWFDGTNLSQMVLLNNDLVLLDFTATSIKIHVAGNYVGSIPRLQTAMSAHFSSDNPGTGFDNIISSFPCKRACRDFKSYPDASKFEFFEGLFDDQGNLIQICPGTQQHEFSVATFAYYAHWSATNGTFSCTDCLTTTFTSTGVDTDITVDIYDDPTYLIDPRSAVICRSYTFRLRRGDCPVEPCDVGLPTVSNNTYPVQYSPCNIPQISYDSTLFYSWTPQVGLSCYDCSNPMLLLSDIQSNIIPSSYEVYVYNSQSDRELGRHCQILQVDMLKKFCAKDCSFEVSVSGSAQQNPCEGDVIVLTGSGAGSFQWTSSLGGLNCEECPQTFYTVQPGTTEIVVSVFNDEGEQCGEQIITITSRENCLSTTGVSYNNYGVNTYVKKDSDDTYLNIYGNVINEIVIDANDDLIKGTFINESNIWVSRDWINNGLNGMFVNYSEAGINVLMGGYQRIRGNSPTKFHTLQLIGQGKKEQFVDAYVYADLDLTVNELATRSFTMFVENEALNAIQRTSGFVSSNLYGGGLSRVMVLHNSGQLYLFPLGSSLGTLRYRPLDVMITEDAGIRRMKSRMVNYDPGYDGLVNLAADVESVNNLYYHQLVPSHPNEDYELLFHYNDLLDGTYQHIAQYEDAILPEYWQKTGIISLGNAFSGYAPNTKFVATTWDYFSSENFALANAGFAIDWEDFGNPNGGTGGGDGGVTVTVTGPSGSEDDDFNDPFPAGEGGEDPSVVLTPAPMAGTYTITVDGGDCVIDGQIQFEVDAAGNILDESIYFISNGVQMPLAESLYSLEATSQFGANGIFDLNAIPESVFAACTDDVKILLSNGIGLIAGAPFTVDVPVTTNLQLEEIIIQNASGTIATISGTNVWQSQITDLPGLYKYELHLLNTTDNSTITLKGQFILTN